MKKSESDIIEDCKKVFIHFLSIYNNEKKRFPILHYNERKKFINYKIEEYTRKFDEVDNFYFFMKNGCILSYNEKEMFLKNMEIIGMFTKLCMYRLEYNKIRRLSTINDIANYTCEVDKVSDHKIFYT